VVFPPAPDFVRGIFPLSAQTCRQSRGLGANSYRKHALLQMLIAALRAAAHRTARDRRPGSVRARSGIYRLKKLHISGKKGITVIAHFNR
jgi:hypothetical protein